MTIHSRQGKTLILIALILVSLFATLYVASHVILLGNYRHLEEQTTRRNVGRVRTALADDFDGLRRTVSDWADWDETYAFVENGNEAYRRANLPPFTFTRLRIDVMVFVQRSGRIVYGASYDRVTGEKRPFPAALRRCLPELLKRSDAKGEGEGILMLPGGPLAFIALPILTNERTGPSRGTLLMGRYLDSRGIARLAKITHLSLTAYPYADPAMPPDVHSVLPLLSGTKSVPVRPLNERSIAGYALLNDAFGQPALVLRVDQGREIYRQGLAAIDYFLLWLAIICLAFGVLAQCLAAKLFRSREQQKQSDERLTYLTTHHPVTGLPNRTQLLERLRQALAYGTRNSLTTAVLQLNLDHFKVINDSLGHSVGDRLLEAVAGHLRECCRMEDTVAHLGGDTFIVLLSDLSAVQGAALFAEKILYIISRPIVLAEREIVVTASIGITVAPLDGQDAETLLKNADIAVFQAKAHGRNTWKFFTAEMNTRMVARLALEADLRRALEREEFLLYYQPRLDASNGRIVGMEALLRWHHPERGLVSPLEFVPMAEETGLILPLGEWALRSACAQNQAWLLAGHPPLRVSVNISAHQLKQADFAAMVGRVLAETGLDPQRLELEITESVLMENVEATLRALTELRTMGIVLAMDDFGTGYSSLFYLKRYPLDLVKIDSSFIRDLTRNESDDVLVRTIIAMTHSLNLRSVAEGVETLEQYNFLRAHGCDEVQGYFFSRPVPAESFVSLVRGE